MLNDKYERVKNLVKNECLPLVIRDFDSSCLMGQEGLKWS